MVFAPTVEDGEEEVWGCVAAMIRRRRRRSRRRRKAPLLPPGPGHPKVEALLHELVNSVLSGDNRSLGVEFAQRGIVVQHIEWKGIHGLCFEIVPYRDNGTVNPTWTGPLPALMDAVHQSGEGLGAGVGGMAADVLPVAEAMGIRGNSMVDGGAGWTGQCDPSVYAVPMPPME